MKGWITMAITVTDIREKEFKTEMRGYSRDEVDDFLDELADQTEELAVENDRLDAEAAKAAEEIATLKAQLDEAVAHIRELEAAPAAPAVETAAPAIVEEAGLPTFNEPSYFKNLETTLRETLISAQRIADETIDDARKKAKSIVSEAEEKAAAVEAESQEKLAKANAELDAIRSAGQQYFASFSALIEEQSKALKDSPLNAAE